MPVAFDVSVVEAQMRYTCLNERVMNTLWFRHTSQGAPGPGDMEALANALLTWWTGFLRPMQHQSTTLREIYLRQAVQDGAQEFSLIPLLNNGGTLNEPPSPNNVTLVISFRSSFSGRARRGRNYSIGMTEPSTVGNQALVNYVDDFVAAYSALPAAIDTETEFEHIIYSQYLGNNPRGLFPIITPVTAYLVTDANLDSQRRRLAGRGS